MPRTTNHELPSIDLSDVIDDESGIERYGEDEALVNLARPSASLRIVLQWLRDHHKLTRH